MKSKTRNWLLAIVIVAFPFTLFCLFLFTGLADGPLPPLAPLPNPNGYGDLVKAGQMIKGIVSDYDKADLEKLRGIVSTNAEVYALARTALSNQCGVPLQFTKAYPSNSLQGLIAFRSLAQALVCEGKFAEKENRFNDAASSYLDTVHLGSQITHGGVLMDEMLGIAVRSLGEMQLQGIVTNLDAPVCRKTAAALETLAADCQTWAATMQQEEAWSRRTYGWRRDWLRWIYPSVRQKNLQRATDTLNKDKLQEGQLLFALAARAYELEKGKPPASVAELVPEYLKAVPQDPVTGTNMVYSPR